MLNKIAIIAILAISGAAASTIPIPASGKSSGNAVSHADIPSQTVDLPTASDKNMAGIGRRLTGDLNLLGDTIPIPASFKANRRTDYRTDIPSQTPDLPNPATDNNQVPNGRRLTGDLSLLGDTIPIPANGKANGNAGSRADIPSQTADLPNPATDNNQVSRGRRMLSIDA